jgi:hypothetical protein
MVKILKEIEKDYYLIELEDTRYYQIWNKWDLFEVLLQNGTNAYTLFVEDFPMSEIELKEIVTKIKNKKQ